MKSLFLFVRQHRSQPETAGLWDTSKCAGGFYRIILALTFTRQSGGQALALSGGSFLKLSTSKYPARYSYDIYLYIDLVMCYRGQPNTFHWVSLLVWIYCTSMVTSDMGSTEPAAGLMVNSAGRAWRFLAGLACQLLRDVSDSCLL